jgi:hypothetical protein
MNIVRPNWEFAEIAGRHQRTNTKRAYIQQAGDYKIVEVKPDFSIIVNDATLRKEIPGRPFSWQVEGLGWLIGEDRHMPDFNKTEQCLYEGYIPIHICNYRENQIEYEQVTFTAKVCGVPMLLSKLKIENLHPGKAQTALITYSTIKCRFCELQVYEERDEDYIPFRSNPSIWQKGESKLEFKDNCLFNGKNIAACFESKSTPKILPGNLISYEIEIFAGENAEISVYMPYEWADLSDFTKEQTGARINNFVEDASFFKQINFDEMLKSEAAKWSDLQRKATQISIPEAPISRIYKTLTLHSLQFIAFPLESEFALCGQGGQSNVSVQYAWEAKYLLNTLDILGYGEYVKPVIDYFLTTQSKIGPEGNIISKEGSFRPHIFWMSETSGVMKVIAYHYFSTKDKSWLASIQTQVVNACEWVRRERNATKVIDDAGNKVMHYGLLPEGRVHDWDDYGNFYFSDAYTWEAYSLCAKALHEIGSIDAKAFQDDADDYLECIRAAYKKTVYPLMSDKSLKYYSNQVYGKPDYLMSSYGLDGPTCMLETGVIESKDAIVNDFYASLEALGYIKDDFTCKIFLTPDAVEVYDKIYKENGNINTLIYYVTTSESIWLKTYLERGELNKALKVFYNTLAFAVSKDLSIVTERFSPEMHWFLPWQPNGSGTGRVLQMINNMLFFEDKDNYLNLFKGVPNHWISPGNIIKVESGRTLSTSISIQAASSLNAKELTIEIELSNPENLKGIKMNLNNWWFNQIEVQNAKIENDENKMLSIVGLTNKITIVLK